MKSTRLKIAFNDDARHKSSPIQPCVLFDSDHDGHVPKYETGRTNPSSHVCFLSFRPGFIRHIFTYIQIHLIHTKYWKNGHGKLALFCYDEVSLSKLALYYKKFDCILEEWACIEIQIIDKANRMCLSLPKMQSNFLKYKASLDIETSS